MACGPSALMEKKSNRSWCELLTCFIHSKMKKRLATTEDTVDFWSELSELSDQNYWKCIEKHLTEDHHSNREGVISIQPRTCDTNINFCKRQPFSFSDNCEPMCNLIKNCEMHDNFLCPDDNKKALMDTCCTLWNQEFKCDYPPNHHNNTTAPPPAQTNPDTPTELNPLVYILPVALFSFAVVIILTILCILKKIKQAESKYKNSGVPRTQSTVSGDYEEYGSDYQSTASGTQINANMNYVSNTPF